jgi:Fe2+ or Zn2+ uptake regulation protein
MSGLRQQPSNPARVPDESPTSGAAGTVRGDEEFAAVLARLGPLGTPQRRAVLRVLLASRRLQTPDQLLAAARLEMPRTSLATVYRTLERLQAAGRLKTAVLSSGSIGYVYCGGSHHEHAICRRCGRVRTIDQCLVTQPELEGFTVESHVIDFNGICEKCAEDAAAGDMSQA